MCLPQVPVMNNSESDVGNNNCADVYFAPDIPNEYAAFNAVGLGLNAAVLGIISKKLRTEVSSTSLDLDVRAFATFSSRIPQRLIEDMITVTGWQVVATYRTPEPIQQDPGTSIKYVSSLPSTDPIQPEEALFYSKHTDELGNVEFEPLTVEEAEQRRCVAFLSGEGRRALNVYHHLIEYELIPLYSSSTTTV